MAKDKKEWISALADGELGGSELGKALDALRSDTSMQRSWTNYHLIRDTLHSNLESSVDASLYARITAAMDKEPVVLAPQRAPKRPWIRHAAGFAVAASVTGIAVFGIQEMNREEDAPVATMAEVMQPGNIVRMEKPTLVAANPDAATAQEDNGKLAPYLVNHNEYSVSSGMHGMLPYVRIVGYESNGQ
jgi:sigma-E factor negative regulatory protein RseA